MKFIDNYLLFFSFLYENKMQFIEISQLCLHSHIYQHNQLRDFQDMHLYVDLIEADKMIFF